MQESPQPTFISMSDEQGGLMKVCQSSQQSWHWAAQGPSHVPARRSTSSSIPLTEKTASVQKGIFKSVSRSSPAGQWHCCALQTLWENYEVLVTAMLSSKPKPGILRMTESQLDARSEECSDSKESIDQSPTEPASRLGDAHTPLQAPHCL